jgi:hypothetical protein
MKGGKDKGRKNKEKKLENRKYFAPMFSLKWHNKVKTKWNCTESGGITLAFRCKDRYDEFYIYLYCAKCTNWQKYMHIINVCVVNFHIKKFYYFIIFQTYLLILPALLLDDSDFLLPLTFSQNSISLPVHCFCQPSYCHVFHSARGNNKRGFSGFN